MILPSKLDYALDALRKLAAPPPPPRKAHPKPNPNKRRRYKQARRKNR